MAGQEPADCSGNGHAARLEGGAALYLEGPVSSAFSGGPTINRAINLAGGFLDTKLSQAGDSSSVELWFWNGLPNDARPETGVLVARDAAKGQSEILGIGGTDRATGRLVFSAGAAARGTLEGKTAVTAKVWHHVVLVRQQEAVSVYLDGRLEIQGQAPGDAMERTLRIGGNRARATLEGKVDEIAVFDRALASTEVAEHFRVAAVSMKAPD